MAARLKAAEVEIQPVPVPPPKVWSSPLFFSDESMAARLKAGEEGERLIVSWSEGAMAAQLDVEASRLIEGVIRDAVLVVEAEAAHSAELDAMERRVAAADAAREEARDEVGTRIQELERLHTEAEAARKEAEEMIAAARKEALEAKQRAEQAEERALVAEAKATEEAAATEMEKEERYMQFELLEQRAEQEAAYMVAEREVAASRECEQQPDQVPPLSAQEVGRTDHGLPLSDFYDSRIETVDGDADGDEYHSSIEFAQE